MAFNVALFIKLMFGVCLLFTTAFAAALPPRGNNIMTFASGIFITTGTVWTWTKIQPLLPLASARFRHLTLITVVIVGVAGMYATLQAIRYELNGVDLQ